MCVCVCVCVCWKVLSVEELEALAAPEQSRGHHAIDRLEERGVERGSLGQPFLKGRERAIGSQSNIINCFKRVTGKSCDRRGGARMDVPERKDTTLNRTKQNFAQQTLLSLTCAPYQLQMAPGQATRGRLLSR